MESAETMQAFLLWLDKDDDAAARRYEDIRQKMIVLFRVRGCSVPEELADETIDRTARAVLKPGFVCQSDAIAYFRGVAHNVYREWVRKERRLPTESIEDDYREPRASPGKDDAEELLQTCLERCLEALLPAKRTLLIRYYGGEKRSKIDGRQLLADEMGMGMNALRVQAFRLRNGLRDCVESCKAGSDIRLVKKT